MRKITRIIVDLNRYAYFYRMVGNSKLLKGLDDKLSRCSKSLYCCLPVCFLLILTNRSSHLTNLGGFAFYMAIHYSSL